MRTLLTLLLLALPLCPAFAADPFERGIGVPLDGVIPTNERGIVCLAESGGVVYGGTTGRAAHLFVYDPAADKVNSLARLPGGLGFANQLAVVGGRTVIWGTRAGPTGVAVQTNADAVGKLYAFHLDGAKPARVEELGVPVRGQGIYALAYDPEAKLVMGMTWPDGHFF